MKMSNSSQPILLTPPFLWEKSEPASLSLKTLKTQITPL